MSSKIKSDTDNLNIFLCTSQEFVIGTYVTISSLIHHLNSSQKTTIHILSQSLDDDSLACIEHLIEESGKPIRFDFKKVNLSIFRTIHEKQNANGDRAFPDDIYAPLLIPSLYPEVGFGIYLDSDPGPKRLERIGSFKKHHNSLVCCKGSQYQNPVRPQRIH
jgi:lipopolysaccharide biosynthesis glycosyltransferase